LAIAILSGIYKMEVKNSFTHSNSVVKDIYICNGCGRVIEEVLFWDGVEWKCKECAGG